MDKALDTKLGVALLVIGGVILWNTWLLGFLNHGVVGYTQMSISELNVNGQPFAHFFTTTEWLSGLLILVGSLFLLPAVRKGGVFLLIALTLTACIGGLTIFDATHPVDCNRYQNKACQLKWARGEVSAVQKAHGLESETTDYITVLLSIEILVWALHQKILKPKETSYLELGFLFILAIAIISPLLTSTGSIVVVSLGQRVWNTITSILFIYIIYRIRRRESSPTIRSYSQRKTRKAIA